jgi:hypothetical protein
VLQCAQTLPPFHYSQPHAPCSSFPQFSSAEARHNPVMVCNKPRQWHLGRCFKGKVGRKRNGEVEAKQLFLGQWAQSFRPTLRDHCAIDFMHPANALIARLEYGRESYQSRKRRCHPISAIPQAQLEIMSYINSN